MRHITILLAFTALLSGNVLKVAAVPAYPGPITVTQSDGTQITVRIYGDEYHHYTLSEEGYTLTGGQDGDYYYATLAADGTLAPTSVKAKPLSKLSKDERAKVAKLHKGIRPTAVSPLRSLRRTFASQAPAPTLAQAPVNGNSAPERISNTVTTGKRKWPIILVQFSDTKFIISDPVTSISNLLNQNGYNVNGSTGSAWNYYYENSGGKFDPEFVVYGPYTVSKRASYYAGSSGSENVAELVVEVCRLADNEIDFSQYNAGGLIQDVILFFAGHNQAEGAKNTIWPHCSDVRYYYRSVYLDGVQLAGYGCFSELYGGSGSRIANIGTFCHEFGHIMGWPDFYDIDYSGAPGTEDFSLMCSGSYNNQSRTPPALNILERWMMGWATPEELTASGYYSLAPITDHKGYLVTSGTANEYFLMEYRGSGKNVWDNPSYIGGSGLIVYHIDNTFEYSYQWANDAPNDDPGHECAKLVRSVPGTKESPMETFFPGSEHITRLSGSSNPLYKSWSGRNPAVELQEIEVTGGAVKLTVKGEGAIKPDLNFKSSAYQYSALLTWTDNESDSWTVAWQPEGASESQSREVRRTEIYLDGLTPGTTYEVTITPSPGGNDKAQEFTFETEPAGDGRLRIVLPKTELLSDTPVSLAIADYPGIPQRIEWYVDGSISTTTYRTLSAGDHTLTAVITAEDGTKEYLIKYITVK